MQQQPQMELLVVVSRIKGQRYKEQCCLPSEHSVEDMMGFLV